MRRNFYPRLAVDGFRKNKRMYLPYLLTCAGMVMMHYIISFLHFTDSLDSVRGAAVIQDMLGLGCGVIAVFACIFLFYTNSFLIRRRKKEFGLYNILGMGKRNIGFILFWENLLIAGASLSLGLLAGVTFSKLAELGLVKLLQGEATFDLSVSWAAMSSTLKVFGVIYLLLFLNALRQIRFSTAISLVRSENLGEKPPRGNWLLGLAGLGLLIAAYDISVSIENPVSALTLFFVAVIMVILGTYLLLIAGSVVFCRLLQKRKSYYYKTNHFISVSSMVYRMKRNGAGLASICILATMVLVMISSTTALYFGQEDALAKRYPQEMSMELSFNNISDLTDETIGDIHQEIQAVLDQHGAASKNLCAYRNVSIGGLLSGTTVEPDIRKAEDLGLDPYSSVYQFFLIPLEDYNAAMAAQETLEPGEALLWIYRSTYSGDTISFNGGQSFTIKRQLDNFAASGSAVMNFLPTIVLVVPDMEAAGAGLDQLTAYNGRPMAQPALIYNFDTDLAREAELALAEDLRSSLRDEQSQTEYAYRSLYFESREEAKVSFFALHGGLFYLGILLSLVFLFATVLIIYYKQISEGYEDQSRFEIMRKVGLSKKEIRRSINSQLLTVFFLPLILAGCHLLFAFPIIRKLLLMFGLDNTVLFVMTTVISFLVFSLFYMVVYRATSDAYYKIVSTAKEDPA